MKDYDAAAVGGFGHPDRHFSNRAVVVPWSTRSHPVPPPPAAPPPPPAQPTTLWWGDLEPWMDQDYAKRVCEMMHWDPVSIKVPHVPNSDGSNNGVPLNPGYCFLTFPSPTHAASVLSQLDPTNHVAGPPLMPNSTRPFNLNWASTPNGSSSAPSRTAISPAYGASSLHPKEYSIFVGDLAPETSNSDLVAVFRNPILGLRNDREPKFIRPFYSCKSAKIMLDPETGVSKGYGFVRFTDENDQQRALIEMHGLYCNSRPMRISAATAKFRPPPSLTLSPVGPIHPAIAALAAEDPSLSPNYMNHLPLSDANQTSVSQRIAVGEQSSLSSSDPPAYMSDSPVKDDFGLDGSHGWSKAIREQQMRGDASEFPSQNQQEPPPASVSMTIKLPTELAKEPSALDIARVQALAQMPYSTSVPESVPTYSQSIKNFPINTPAEAEALTRQARAILGSLVGPNGEQVTQHDPYNTTVFVGGLSELISEDTLRSFFAPFGDIHYVKVPPGKHCGFVQFVHKKDAQRAIERMQSFPIGGNKIRLSWGRSQYKAAAAAAQAAAQARERIELEAQLAAPANQVVVTPEQAIAILRQHGYQVPSMGPSLSSSSASSTAYDSDGSQAGSLWGLGPGPLGQLHQYISSQKKKFNSFDLDDYRENRQVPSSTAFSPFSPNPGGLHSVDENKAPTSTSFSTSQSRNFSPTVAPPTATARPHSSLSNSTSSSSVKHRPTIERSESRDFLNTSGLQPRPLHSELEQHREDSAITDVNGMLASLDLDLRTRPPSRKLNPPSNRLGTPMSAEALS